MPGNPLQRDMRKPPYDGFDLRPDGKGGMVNLGTVHITCKCPTCHPPKHPDDCECPNCWEAMEHGGQKA